MSPATPATTSAAAASSRGKKRRKRQKSKLRKSDHLNSSGSSTSSNTSQEEISRLKKSSSSRSRSRSHSRRKRKSLKSLDLQPYRLQQQPHGYPYPPGFPMPMMMMEPPRSKVLLLQVPWYLSDKDNNDSDAVQENVSTSDNTSSNIIHPQSAQNLLQYRKVVTPDETVESFLQRFLYEQMPHKCWRVLLEQQQHMLIFKDDGDTENKKAKISKLTTQDSYVNIIVRTGPHRSFVLQLHDTGNTNTEAVSTNQDTHSVPELHVCLGLASQPGIVWTATDCVLDLFLGSDSPTKEPLTMFVSERPIYADSSKAIEEGWAAVVDPLVVHILPVSPSKRPGSAEKATNSKESTHAKDGEPARIKHLKTTDHDPSVATVAPRGQVEEKKHQEKRKKTEKQVKKSPQKQQEKQMKISATILDAKQDANTEKETYNTKHKEQKRASKAPEKEVELEVVNNGGTASDNKEGTKAEISDRVASVEQDGKGDGHKSKTVEDSEEEKEKENRIPKGDNDGDEQGDEEFDDSAHDDEPLINLLVAKRTTNLSQANNESYDDQEKSGGDNGNVNTGRVDTQKQLKRPRTQEDPPPSPAPIQPESEGLSESSPPSRQISREERRAKLARKRKVSEVRTIKNHQEKKIGTILQAEVEPALGVDSAPNDGEKARQVSKEKIDSGPPIHEVQIPASSSTPEIGEHWQSPKRKASSVNAQRESVDGTNNNGGASDGSETRDILSKDTSANGARTPKPASLQPEPSKAADREVDDDKSVSSSSSSSSSSNISSSSSSGSSASGDSDSSTGSYGKNTKQKAQVATHHTDTSEKCEKEVKSPAEVKGDIEPKRLVDRLPETKADERFKAADASTRDDVNMPPKLDSDDASQQVVKMPVVSQDANGASKGADSDSSSSSSSSSSASSSSSNDSDSDSDSDVSLSAPVRSIGTGTQLAATPLPGRNNRKRSLEAIKPVPQTDPPRQRRRPLLAPNKKIIISPWRNGGGRKSM